jgi:hypothetical protein
MNQRPRPLGDLFHRIVWLLAVPAAGCGSSVTAGPGTDAGADVAPPIDRAPPVDAGRDAGPSHDTADLDVGTRDAGTPDAGTPDSGCAPRAGGDVGGACEEVVLYPCGLPVEAQVDAGSYLPYEQCRTLCATATFGGGGCRRLERLADGTDRVVPPGSARSKAPRSAARWAISSPAWRRWSGPR